VDDQPSRALLFNFLLGPFPELPDHVDGLSALGKQPREMEYIGPNTPCR
jgi:hypothetical protein